MRELKRGQTIQTRGFKTVEVMEKLGEGGQGTVYKVKYDGRDMALKWYFPSKLKKPTQFYDNIKNNIAMGRPTDAFLWPEDITEWEGDSFGYVMPLRPKEYGDFSKYLLARERFHSTAALVNAALNIVDGFTVLHRSGFNYQDLNDGNFFVNFQTGDVLICDNDNVMGYGFNSGIAGKCRYMAPEVVLGKTMPDKQTDRYSLAVVLFLLLFANHPLEGKNTNPPCMTEELERKYYGSNPVFIFDPADKSNAPIRGIHCNAIARWPQFPQYVRDAFIEAFSKEQLCGVRPRTLDSEWLRLFVRLRDDLITCTCGNEMFIEPGKTLRCDQCGKTVSVSMYLQFKKNKLLIYPGVKLYACHTMGRDDDFRTVTAEIIESRNPRGILGIRNLSDVTWYNVGPDGTQAPVRKSEVVKAEKGRKINFGNNIVGEIL